MLVLAMWIINVHNCEESSKLFTYGHHQFQIVVHIVGSKRSLNHHCPHPSMQQDMEELQQLLHPLNQGSPHNSTLLLILNYNLRDHGQSIQAESP